MGLGRGGCDRGVTGKGAFVSEWEHGRKQTAARARAAALNRIAPIIGSTSSHEIIFSSWI